jgi:hypothetical protein
MAQDVFHGNDSAACVESLQASEKEVEKLPAKCFFCIQWKTFSCEGKHVFCVLL